jgi:hypothetical protein
MRDSNWKVPVDRQRYSFDQSRQGVSSRETGQGEEVYRISEENIDDLVEYLKPLLKRAGLAIAEEADKRI